MKRILVWDLPVRLFHWLLTVGFVGAFLIAQTVSDESALFPVHMLLGGIIAFMVLLRVVWGFAGTRWARFRSFVVRPGEVFKYFTSAFAGVTRRYAGHNPGSSLATIVMFVFLLGLAVTGIMMGNGAPHLAEEVHEMLAWGMAIVVGVHLLGILWHTIRHRENIAMSMVHGQKSGDPADAIPSARPVVATVFLVLTLLFAVGLMRGYDRDSGRVNLPLIGEVMQLEHEHH